MSEVKKRCIECSGEYPLLFFRKNPHGGGIRVCPRARCKRCEQNRRDLEKKSDRFRVKASNTIRSHEAKFVIRNVCLKGDLRKKFGWSIDKLSHDFEHAYKNGCLDCRQMFADMPNGLSSMTLDVIDATKKPYYGVNTRIICSTCNKEKQRSSPDEWGEIQHCHRLWEENKKKNDSDFYKGTLLEKIAQMD